MATLLAQYGFSEGVGATAADSSGNGRTLTLVGGQTGWTPNGKTGAGAQKYFSGNPGPNSALTDYTVMAWIKMPAFGSWWTVFGDNSTMWFEVSTAGVVDCFLSGAAIFGPTLTAGTWTHIAVTSSGASGILYVNGVQVATGTGASKNFGTGTWYVAGDPGQTGAAGNLADEVRVFDAALNAATIQALMGIPVDPVSQTDLVNTFLPGGTLLALEESGVEPLGFLYRPAPLQILDRIPAGPAGAPFIVGSSLVGTDLLEGTLSAGAAATVAQTDSAGLTDSTVFDQSKVITDSAGLTDTTDFDQSKIITDSAGLTDTAALTVAPVVTDSAGLTDSSTVELSKLVTVTDSAGLTDGTVFDLSKVQTDSAGLTDSAELTRSLIYTDSAGLTDTSTVELVKLVAATDDAGLTDAAVFNQAKVQTDSIGLTDSAALDQSKILTDSAGLTDTTLVASGKLLDLTDTVGLTDTQVFDRSLINTDSAGLTDTTALTLAKIITDSAGLTDTALAGILRDIAVTDSAGLTDSQVFARSLGLDDLVGLTDTASLARLQVLTDSAGLTDAATAVVTALQVYGTGGAGHTMPGTGGAGRGTAVSGRAGSALVGSGSSGRG
jgi:hypothetical protein